MKRLFLQLLLCAACLNVFAITDPQFFYHTVQVGKKITISSNTYDHFAYYETRCDSYTQFDPSIISLSRNGTNYTVQGLRKGTTTIISLPAMAYNNTVPYFHIITVVDVYNISIVPSLNIVSGEEFLYTPIITDQEATTVLTWTSSNTDVATVSSNGIVTAISPGNTTITCKATNGISAQSIVTVTPMLMQEVTIDMNKYEMSIGDKKHLTATTVPENASISAINWISGNENIAQVDSEGNVTAIASGYCSVYAIAGDGSGKYDKCLIHVTGNTPIKGDMNGDGEVSAQDASIILQYVAKKVSW